jgi:hypothetical protein
MAKFSRQSSAARKTKPPPLVHGERLDQKTFHERYEAMPSHVRAELIGGIVYMSSPQKIRHSVAHPWFVLWLGGYRRRTPGTQLLLNATDILGPKSEPQPDACLVLLPEYGGRTWADANNYLNGAAELVGEISDATEAVDLNAKKLDYDKAGVLEYLVAALRMKRVFRFVRRRGKFKEMRAGPDGILRSKVFPGLWLGPDALLRNDRQALLAVLRQGLASPEHASLSRNYSSAARKKSDSRSQPFADGSRLLTASQSTKRRAVAPLSRHRGSRDTEL